MTTSTVWFARSQSGASVLGVQFFGSAGSRQTALNGAMRESRQPCCIAGYRGGRAEAADGRPEFRNWRAGTASTGVPEGTPMTRTYATRA